MSILSRFRRQKEDEASEELDAALANSEEEGLFISTGTEQASPGGEAEPAAGTPVDNDATSQAEIDDLLEAAESDATPSTIGEAVAENSEETAASEAKVDDLLPAQVEPAAAEGADATPIAEDAAPSEPEVDDLLEAAEGTGARPAVADAATSESEVDDLLETAQGGGAAAEQEEADQLDVGTPAAEESTEASDDPLAAFGEVVAESEMSGLVKELEDVSVEELVAELREIRAMLPQIEEGQEAA